MQHFRDFIKKELPRACHQMTQQEIDKLGEEFHKYLKSRLDQDTYNSITPKSPVYSNLFTEFINKNLKPQS